MTELRGYAKLIVELCGCPPERAAEVEEFMRLEHPTLDGLSRAKFRSEARICWQAVLYADVHPEEFQL